MCREYTRVFPTAKYYEMRRPRTFNYWQSIFVATVIGFGYVCVCMCAAGATHKVICPETRYSPLPHTHTHTATTIDYYTIASEYSALFIPLNYTALIDRIDFPEFTPQNCRPTRR